MFGFDPRSPLREGQVDTTDLDTIRQVREAIRSQTRNNIESAQAKQKEYYDRHHRRCDLRIGDLVLVREHTVHTT